MSKSDTKFAEQIKEVIKGLNKRMGKKMCSELHSGCFDCQTRWTIGMLNQWMDLLDWKIDKKIK